MKTRFALALSALIILPSCETADISASYGGKSVALKDGVVSISYDLKQRARVSVGKSVIPETQPAAEPQKPGAWWKSLIK